MLISHQAIYNILQKQRNIYDFQLKFNVYNVKNTIQFIFIYNSLYILNKEIKNFYQTTTHL